MELYDRKSTIDTAEHIDQSNKKEASSLKQSNSQELMEEKAIDQSNKSNLTLRQRNEKIKANKI